MKGEGDGVTFGQLFRKWGLVSIKLNVGFAELEFNATEDDQTAAWEMYIELLTRVTTQPIEDSMGDEETALTSIFNLFDSTRKILREKGRQANNFAKISIIVLNQIIRPFTAKWHKKKLSGAFFCEDECEAFRDELRKLQEKLVCYTRLLADMAMVEDLTWIIAESDN